MRILWCPLGLFKLRLVAIPKAVAATIVSTGGPFSCEPSPTQDLLPDVIAPMTGTSPAWLVDGHTMWPGALEPVKTFGYCEDPRVGSHIRSAHGRRRLGYAGSRQ